MRETILKLLKSTNLDDVILALHLAYKHESRDWFDSISNNSCSSTFQDLDINLSEDIITQFVWDGKYYYIDGNVIWTTIKYPCDRDEELSLIILE